MLDGRLALLTPEGVSLSLVPAGPTRRAVAWAIDTLLWGVGMLLLALLFRGSRVGSGLWLLALFLSYWGYPILFEVYGRGMTLGKRWLGLQVLRSNGLPVGWRESTLRNLLLVADFLPFGYGLGLVCMLGDGQFRRLGDLVAGTLVVYREAAPIPPPVDAATPQPLPRPLLPEEQRALLDLVERGPRLPTARRLELADLAEPLTQRVGEASWQRLRAFAAGLTR